MEKILPAITLQDMKEATKNDPELAKILEEKQKGKMSTETSKGPYAKMWGEITERDGMLLKGQQMIVPKKLQAQAIALAHEGHMQTDGTLRQLRESQWFRNMRKEVKAYVDSCKCQTAKPQNPTPPLKLKPLPKIPWLITAVDYKGPIGPQKYYLHTQMDLYSRYPEVHLTKSTSMLELKKVLAQTMRSHGKPAEIWSDGGAPYNGGEWEEWVRSWGTKPKKTTPEHPPANGMVERFNQELKHVLHAAYAEDKDPEEEVNKFVAAYRNTPHSSTGEKPSKLLFGRDVATKLPRFQKTPAGKHHQSARKMEKEKKDEMKRQYDRKHRVRLTDIKVGDWAYRRNRNVTTTRGPWEAIPFQITEVYFDKITGDRDGQVLTRDRKDWKKLEARPDHLIPREVETTAPARRPAAYGGGPAILLDPDDDWTPGIKTRSAKRKAEQAPPPAPPTPPTSPAPLIPLDETPRQPR